MATIAQIDANSRNAQKSTGPRTAEGKSRSSMNALKSGIDTLSEIIPGEDPMALNDLTHEYQDRFRPATPEERHCVDVLIRADWRLRRLAAAEAQLWNYRMELARQNALRQNAKHPLGQAFCNGDLQFARLQRCIDSTERSYRHALRELQRLQENREPPPDPPVASQTGEQIGFVPSSHEPPLGVVPIRRPDRLLPSVIPPQPPNNQCQRTAELE
jgi:hypothetical protein